MISEENQKIRPYQPLELFFDKWNLKTFQVNPGIDRYGQQAYIIYINGVNYKKLYDDIQYSMDLTTIGIGGLVDGISLSNGREYLIWGFANNANNDFSGFACTRKPFSTYTGPASIPKSSTPVSVTGLTNAYQFTEGARIAIRNTVGTQPQYQWNWGTIQSVDSNTQITVVMDTDSNYGVALTAVTGGEILQWDKFRPWVVTSSGQTLYTNNYRLCGELITDATTGNIVNIYRVDAEWRQVRTATNKIYDSTSLTTGITVSGGRFIPLWTPIAKIFIAIRTTAGGRLFQVATRAQWGQMQQWTQIASTYINQLGIVKLDEDARVLIIANVSDIEINRVYLSGYSVPGGMRL